MATTDEKTITLKLKVPMKTLIEAQHAAGRNYFNDPEITQENFIALLEKMHKVVSKKHKRLLMIEPDKQASKLFSEVARLFFDMVEGYRNLDVYFVRKDIYLAGPKFRIEEFGGVQLCYLDQLREADPELFNVSCRIMATLYHRFGFYDLENLDEYLSEEESIDNNLDMAIDDKDQESIMKYQDMRDETNIIRKGSYRNLMNHIKKLDPLSVDECRSILKDMNHFGENRTTVQRVRKRLYIILDGFRYLPTLDLISNYAVGIDFMNTDTSPNISSQDEMKLRAEKCYVLIWKFETPLWKEVSQSIDDQVHNYGIEKLLPRTMLLGSFPEYEKIQRLMDLYREFGNFTYVVKSIRNLYNDNRLLTSYIKKCKENGTNSSPIFHKAKSLIDIIPV